MFGVLVNTPCPAVNNGVIVTLDFGTVWTLTGDVCLSALFINDGSRIVGADGKAVILTVDGEEKPLRSGKYKGDIRLTLK